MGTGVPGIGNATCDASASAMAKPAMPIAVTLAGRVTASVPALVLVLPILLYQAYAFDPSCSGPAATSSFCETPDG